VVAPGRSRQSMIKTLPFAGGVGSQTPDSLATTCGVPVMASMASLLALHCMLCVLWASPCLELSQQQLLFFCSLCFPLLHFRPHLVDGHGSISTKDDTHTQARNNNGTNAINCLTGSSMQKHRLQPTLSMGHVLGSEPYLNPHIASPGSQCNPEDSA